jgi:DNA-binding response OmpR family regulator
MKTTKVIGSIQKEPTVMAKRNHTIVVADDDPAILDAMQMILELYGFQVETINDHAIVPKLLSIRPKLVFLDIAMSGIDGRDVCRALKSIDSMKDIPVVMISASSNLVNVIEEAGADDYLAKPFELQDLISKVNKFLLN